MTTALITRGTALAALAETLSITPEQHEAVCAAYDDLGAWLQEGIESHWDVAVYPQGSQRFGTTNQDPVTGRFDADAVIRVAVAKDNITQRELNRLVGGWLVRYVDQRQAQGHPLAPQDIEPKKRAWTLTYAGFHIDVLPVVPDAKPGTGFRDPSWLTDKDLRYWQPTDPRAFAAWFDKVSEKERAQRSVTKAAEADVDVEDLPPLTVKTTLQQSVQLLKRHRDHMFAHDPDAVAPPSIIIATLAGRAYADRTPLGGRLEDVLDTVVPVMREYVGWDGGVLWIPNPGYDNENYADRYRDRPDRLLALRDWLDTAASDFALEAGGLDKMAASIDKSFGSNLGDLVTKRLADHLQGAREAGRLGSVAAGTLTRNPSRPHPDHEFYGRPDA